VDVARVKLEFRFFSWRLFRNTRSKEVTFGEKKKKRGESCNSPYNGAAYFPSTKSHFYRVYFQRKSLTFSDS